MQAYVKAVSAYITNMHTAAEAGSNLAGHDQYRETTFTDSSENYRE